MGHARFGLAPIGDVFVGLDQVLRLTSVVEHGHAPGQKQAQSVLGLDRMLLGHDALLANGIVITLADEHRIGGVVDVFDRTADDLVAGPVQRRRGAAVGKNILAVAQPLDHHRDRDVVHDRFKEFLRALDFARQRSAFGNVLEQGDEKFRAALFIAGNHAIARHEALVAMELDQQFSARLAGGRHDGVVVRLRDSLCHLGNVNFLGRMTDDLVAADAGELLERTIGQNVAAILDVLHGDADGNIVDHRLEEMSGVGKLLRQPALIGAILVRRDDAAIGELAMLDQDGASIRQLANAPVRALHSAIVFVDVAAQHTPAGAQFRQFASGYSGADIGAGKSVGLQITIVAENNALTRIDHDDADGQAIERAGDKGGAADIGVACAAQGRRNPENDRGKKRDNHQTADHHLPDQGGLRSVDCHSRKCPVGIGDDLCGCLAGYQNQGAQARSKPCPARCGSSCLLLPAAHYHSTEFFIRNLWLYLFGSGKRVSLRCSQCGLNASNWRSMLNQALTRDAPQRGELDRK